MQVVSEGQFRMGVLSGGVLLVIVLGSLQFCGAVTLPSKPPPPQVVTGSSSQLMAESAGTQTIYMQLVARDAATAGVVTPTYSELSRELVYRASADRLVLSVGDAPIRVAGLQLEATHTGAALALTITNTTGQPVTYRVVTAVLPSGGKCTTIDPIGHDAMVLARGASATRAECTYRPDLSIAVLGVETIELSPLSAYYLNQVPPAAVGIEPRIARQHVGPVTRDKCAPVVGQALKTLIETGKITWRDLADFYARHRCQTYQFPLSYRAITSKSPRSIPAVRDEP